VGDGTSWRKKGGGSRAFSDCVEAFITQKNSKSTGEQRLEFRKVTNRWLKFHVGKEKRESDHQTIGVGKRSTDNGGGGKV